MGYLLTAEVNARLDSAVAVHGTLPRTGRVATRHGWTTGHEGKSAGYVKIGASIPASPAHRWSVMITGGVHARELAPPDALVSFVERLLAAYAGGTGVHYPAFTTDGVTLPRVRRRRRRGARGGRDAEPGGGAAGQRRRSRLRAGPAAGGDPAMTRAAQGCGARTGGPSPRASPTRRPPGSTSTGTSTSCSSSRSTTRAGAGVRTSLDPLQDSYCGTDAESEPETKNLVKVFRDEGISYYLDVHSTGRTVMYSWGIESNQSTDPGQSFMNARKDGQRDGTGGSAYREYIPAAHESAAMTMAILMCNAIATRGRRRRSHRASRARPTGPSPRPTSTSPAARPTTSASAGGSRPPRRVGPSDP